MALAAEGWLKGTAMNEADKGDESVRSVQADKLLTRLLKVPRQFEFFHAVRLLHQFHNRQRRAGQTQPQSSHATRSPSSGLRFRSSTNLDFSSGAISEIAVRHSEATASGVEEDANSVTDLDVEVTHFGFIGPSGTLPQHYTDLVISQYRRFRDKTLRRFLDVFLHRFTDLLCLAWGKYRGHIAYENLRIQRNRCDVSRENDPESDPLTVSLSSLIGINTERDMDHLQIPKDALLYHAAHLLRRPRTAESLEKMVGDLLSLPVKIVPFAGGWLSLAERDRTRLAGGLYPSGQHAVLGQTAIVGSRIWDCASAFELRIGPLSTSEFTNLLPGQPRLRAVEELLRFAVGSQFSVKTRLILAGSEIPGCCLTTQHLTSAIQPQLGWSCWLAPPGRKSEDRDETAFEAFV